MSEPKISRRCAACGASIRERAYFCPQCGKALEEEDVDPVAAPATTPLVDPQFLQPDLNDTIVESKVPDETVVEKVERAPVTSSDQTRRLDRDGRNRRRHDRSRNPGSTPAAEPDHSSKSERPVLQRVEKLRKVSSVVIDEATYDPSLRFILVAAALFLFFLGIIILNKIIG
jgi:hypothetical protein